MQIPSMWIYNYHDQLPENSIERITIADMLIKFMKEQEEAEKNEEHLNGGEMDDHIGSCMNCRFEPPGKKWSCVDCDVTIHDRGEPKNDNVDCGMITNWRLLGDN